MDATKREVCVQVQMRGKRGRGRGFCVALTQEEHRRGHRLRVVSIQERADYVRELPRRGVKIRVRKQTERSEGDFFGGGVYLVKEMVMKKVKQKMVVVTLVLSFAIVTGMITGIIVNDYRNNHRRRCPK